MSRKRGPPTSQTFPTDGQIINIFGKSTIIIVGPSICEVCDVIDYDHELVYAKLTRSVAVVRVSLH